LNSAKETGSLFEDVFPIWSYEDWWKGKEAGEEGKIFFQRPRRTSTARTRKVAVASPAPLQVCSFGICGHCPDLFDARGFVFALPVSKTICKVKESFGDGFVKKSKEIFFSFFLFVSFVGIGASALKSFVPCVFCS
jgi:hypothetical protein